jgi:SAM-dependent methyltransferase
VLCVESAFHYEGRERFFAEVRRVLAPGGRLSMADLVPLPPRGVADRVAWRFTRDGLSVPEQNVLRVEDYRASLERAGLCVRTFRSIVDDVYPPFRRWQLRQPLQGLVRIHP